MKILKYNIIVLLLIFSSCTGFLDVNTNPTKVSLEDVKVDVLLPTVIEGTSSAHYSTAYYAARVTHQLDAIQAGYYEKFTMAGAWSTIYLKNLMNTDLLIDKANEEGSAHFAGVGKVLKAVNLALLTDCWEDVPYTEALQGSNNVAPGYDSQQSIYAALNTILTEAINDLEAGDSFRDIGGEDFIYGGNTDQWLKLAHSLKARYLLHLSNTPNGNWDLVLSEAALGMAGNDDDFQLNYTPDVSNPWYNNISRKILEVIYTLTYGDYFMDNLNGTNYPVIDPRLPILAEKIDADGDYKGLASYEDENDYNVLPTVNTFYMQAESPLVMMSFAELKFIEAEAALNTGDAARAYQAYLDGIAANMSKLGVDGVDMDAYLSDPAVAIGTADLEHIMKEKYIALALNTEVWNDMRRHDFSTDVYKNFIVPDYNGRTVPGQRAVYPSSEESRNNANYSANLKEFTEKMWKDK